MNRTSIAMLLLVAAVATSGAQVAAPARPAKPARPTPTTPPASPTPPAPVAAPVPWSWDDEISRWEIERIIRQQAEENARVQADAVRAQAEAIRIDADAIREQVFDQVHIARDDIARALAQAKVVRIDNAFHFDDARIPHPEYQGEPEDSLYRLAHDALNRGDYGRAAQIFRDIAQRYPKSVYTNDLSYYEALARYRVGTSDELNRAARLLEPRASKLAPAVAQSGNTVVISGQGINAYPKAITYSNVRRSASDGDVLELYVRINSALASRGDRYAANVVSRLAQAGANTCDADDMSIRTEALSALMTMDPSDAMPKVRQVLNNRDECSETLRSRAVFLLGSKRGDADAAELIAQAAKSDPSRRVRMDAITWLPKLQGDAGVAALQDILRTEDDENMQRQIVRTLVSSDNVRARSSMRALIDRRDASLSLRIAAIDAYGNDRSTAEDAAYLRSLYSRAENDRMRDAIINSVARIGGQDSEQWLLNIAKNPNEPSQARSTAINRLFRSNMSISDVVRIYDLSDSRDVRSRIINLLGSRKEAEATDKLIEIAKTSTVQQLRVQAIQTLTNRKNDPRAQQLLLDLVDGKSRP